MHSLAYCLNTFCLIYMGWGWWEGHFIAVLLIHNKSEILICMDLCLNFGLSVPCILYYHLFSVPPPSSWYDVDYSVASPLRFGLCLGCDFAEKSCFSFGWVTFDL